MKVNIIPISINRCWQGRRFKTKEYKDWREEFLWKTNSIQKEMITKPTAIVVEFFVKNEKMTDTDNLIKPFFDALKDAGFVKDDRLIKEILVFKTKVKTKEEEGIYFKFAPSILEYITELLYKK
jgi:Holliday junction resolvase RusA-like endonuclease